MKTRLLPMLAAACWITTSSAAPIDWHLYDSACAGGAAAVEIACGSHGRYLLLQTAAPPGCVPLASGSEIPPGYPKDHFAHAFPFPVRELGDVTSFPSPNAAIAAPERERRRLPRGHATSAVTAPPMHEAPDSLERWIGVIDFDGAHGASTTWLAGEVAGPSVVSLFTSLEDDALDVLGSVSDFHVLAKVCEIAQVVDSGSLRAPLTVNMSFGRPTRAIDPTSPAACPAQNAACQIASVVHHLKGQGTYLVAAAGNHRARLFPASLDDVLAAGMLDLTPFFDGGPTRPAWETPPDVDAWIPGNALCLRAWPAPAGSSYSSAMLAGWLVGVLDHPDVLATLGEGPWVPAWDRARECFVLAKGRTPTRYCNAAITTLFDRLRGATVDDCRLAATEPSLSASPPPGPANSPAPLPSLDTWGDPTHPAPESDPCVPCTGGIISNGSSSDLHLDLSQSGALPLGIVMDEISLRVDDSFYDLALSNFDLVYFEDGSLAALVIHDAGALIPLHASLSLWYRMHDDTVDDCSGPSGCFWSSTPLLLGP